MVITSKINNEIYQWIRIPRTATIAYSNLFSNDSSSELDYPKGHTHYKYNQFSRCKHCIEIPDLNLPAFTMVRFPVDRFISSIHFLVGRQLDNFVPKKMYTLCDMCQEYILSEPKNRTASLDFFKFYKDEKIFYEFFYDNFNKNCEPKHGLDFYKIFEVIDNSLVSSFFYTQVYWAYHPKVKIFKYEEISKFNNWIEENLGYDTSQLTHINASRKKELSDAVNIDFTTDKFKKLVKHLFYDDFRYFNYEFPI
jgi:hypothetical protein